MSSKSNIEARRKAVTDSIIRRLSEELTSLGVGTTDVSIKIGRGRAWFSNMITNGSSPTATDLLLIATQYGVNLGRILEAPVLEASEREDMLTELNLRTRDSHGFDRPEVVEVIQQIAKTGGVMNSQTPYLKFVDLYARPDVKALMPKPVMVGIDSLSSKTLAKSTEDLRKIYELATRDVREEVVKSQDHVMSTGRVDLATKNLSFNAGPGIEIKMQYQRLLVPFVDKSGVRMVANYSRPIKRTEILSDIPAHELIERSKAESREIFNNPDA